ncbi:MAG: hypothetical protein GXP58_12205, partial [Deltaproteobacteria bacterium]|nr:hypothetical protein [Deltaproteobacteria bacterium]
MLKLEYGKPQHEKPASFTRFVLPFAYSLQRLNVRKGTSDTDYQWKEIHEDRYWREKYFTPETGKVLFKRAKWFQLEQVDKEWDWTYPMYFREGRILPISMSKPRLVLFEYTEEERRDIPEGGDLLQVGFLVIELFFTKVPEDTSLDMPTLDDLLELNEQFRYWERPFDRHECKGLLDLMGDIPASFGSKETLADRAIKPEQDLYAERWKSFLRFPICCQGKTFRFSTDLIYADNRTFTWACAILPNGGGDLRRQYGHFLKPWELGHWIKLLNVDAPGDSPYATHLSRTFEREWAEERTYKRWEEEGTFYGFNYHSGAMLAPPDSDPNLCEHF